MKEATGELNMTVVTVVAIAAVAAFFYAFVWPGIRNSINQSTYCSMAVCNSDYTQCEVSAEQTDNGKGWSGSCKSYYDKQNEGAGSDKKTET